MKIRSILFINGLIALMLGCTPKQAQVKTNYDKTIDFSTYNTYKILETSYLDSAAPVQSEESQQFINQEVASQLENKGFQQSDEPDVLVHVKVMVVSKARKRPRTPQDGPYYFGQRRYSWSASDSIQVGYYKEGTLSIDLIDTEQNKLVWSSAAKGIVDDNWEDEKQEIKQAITNMFADFPPENQETGLSSKKE